MYTGINPQCIPKITKICQVNPTTAPARRGLIFLIARTVSEIIVEPKIVTGPIYINPAGSAVRSVSIGTKKNFTKSGINLLKNFSHFEAKYTTKIIGITVPV